MLRSILSVSIGFIAWYIHIVILWVLFGYSAEREPPQEFLAFSLCVEALFAAGAGYISGLIARNKALLHGLLLGAVFALFGVVGVIVYILRDYTTPLWVPLSTILIIAPCAALGGWLRSRRYDRLWDESIKKGGP